jgi:hypothetical protein
MWTPENRPKYDRSELRYPSDLTDEEWAIVAPLIPPAKRGGDKRTIDERAVVDGLMYSRPSRAGIRRLSDPITRRPHDGARPHRGAARIGERVAQAHPGGPPWHALRTGVGAGSRGGWPSCG